MPVDDDTNYTVLYQEIIRKYGRDFTPFDTDCNGATVGSVLGMANGFKSIDLYWRESIHDTLHTSIFGIGTVKISDRVAMTMEHIKT